MNQEKLMNILLEPRVTEKSTMVADKSNQWLRVVTGLGLVPPRQGAVAAAPAESCRSHGSEGHLQELLSRYRHPLPFQHIQQPFQEV